MNAVSQHLPSEAGVSVSVEGVQQGLTGASLGSLGFPALRLENGQSVAKNGNASLVGGRND